MRAAHACASFFLSETLKFALFLFCPHGVVRYACLYCSSVSCPSFLPLIWHVMVMPACRWQSVSAWVLSVDLSADAWTVEAEAEASCVIQNSPHVV